MAGEKLWTPAQLAEYCLARLMAYLPIDWTSDIGAFLGVQTGKNAMRDQRLWIKRLQGNLGEHFGISAPLELNQATCQYMSRVGRVYAEFMVQQKIVRQGRLEIIGQENLPSTDHQVIIASCHLANWELVGHVAAQLKRPVCAIYLPPKSPVEHHLAIKARKRWPVPFELVPTSPATMRHVNKAIHRGSNILIFVDEEKDGYVAAPSLGRQIPYSGNRWYASRLAVMHNMDILPVHIEPAGKARYQAIVSPVISAPETESNDQKARQLADALNDIMNECIGRLMEHWYWLPDFDRNKPPNTNTSTPAQA